MEDLKNCLIKRSKNRRAKVSFFAIFFLMISFIISSLCLGLLAGQKTLAAPPSSPSSLALSLSTNDLNINMDSAFKTSNIRVNVQTNSTTGYTLSLSDTDEDTRLIASTTGNTTSFSSISANTTATNFATETWGYSLDNTTFRSIPKKSVAEIIKNSSSPTATSGDNTDIYIGVKADTSTPPDTYRGALEISAITNHIPTSATFLPGVQFHAKYFDLVKDRSDSEMWFKKSLIQPASPATAVVVSTTDSETPIYMWYETSNQTVYWWSEADTVYTNKDCNLMFGESSQKYANMHLDLRGIDASKTVNMSFMFGVQSGSEQNIKTIDLSGFNASNVTNMSRMFNRLENIETLDLSSLNTSNVTNMSGMFFATTNLVSLNLSGFNTEKVVNMSNMFAYMEKIPSLNLGSFNTSNVTDMSRMFSYTKSLTSLDLSNFDTSKVVNMSIMFSTSGVPSLNLSNFNTSLVSNMRHMFSYMSNITTLDLTSFNTQNVTDMSGMFIATADSNIETLDLSSFNTQSLLNVNEMFHNLRKLKTIKTSSLFTTDSITSDNNMFFYNIELVGGNGTTYNHANPRNKTYARIDAPSTPGYFTQGP